MRLVKPDNEQLEEVFKHSDSLNEFLLACADVYYGGTFEVNCDIDDLPESELIELFDWWKKKRAKQKYTIQLLPNKKGFLNRYSDGNFLFVMMKLHVNTKLTLLCKKSNSLNNVMI